MGQEIRVPVPSAALNMLKSKYIHLLETDCDRLTGQAIQIVLDSDIRGVFALEEATREGLEFMLASHTDNSIEREICDFSVSSITGRHRDFLSDRYPIFSKELRVAEGRSSVGEVAKAWRSYHASLWQKLEYLSDAINRVGEAKISEYRGAQSEAQLISLPAPDWPNLELLYEAYGDPTSVP